MTKTAALQSIVATNAPIGAGVVLVKKIYDDGTVTVLAPETSWDCPVYQGETYCFATTASYKGENFTVWFDADPSCITPYDWSPAGYSATIGTTIDFDAIFTIGSDYIPRTDSDNMWHAYETFEVISLF